MSHIIATRMYVRRIKDPMVKMDKLLVYIVTIFKLECCVCVFRPLYPFRVLSPDPLPW